MSSKSRRRCSILLVDSSTSAAAYAIGYAISREKAAVVTETVVVLQGATLQQCYYWKIHCIGRPPPGLGDDGIKYRVVTSIGPSAQRLVSDYLDLMIVGSAIVGI